MAIIDALVKKLSTIAFVSQEDRALLATLPVKIRTLRAGEDLVPQGSTPDYSVFVIEGVLARYQVFGNGDRQTVSFHFEGEAPDLHTLFIHRMDHALGALRDARVGILLHEHVRGVIAESHTLNGILWRETLIDAAIFRQWIANNGKRGGLAGTAHLLCELITRARALDLFPQDGTWQMPFTQQELADAAGLSLVHINRTLRRLRVSEAVVIEQGRLRVLDWNRLAKFAGFEPTYLHLNNEYIIQTGRTDAR